MPTDTSQNPQDVVDILSTFDAQMPTEKTFLRLISQPPRRMYFPTLLLMLCGVGLLALAPMFPVWLLDPIGLAYDQHIPMIYTFQLPAVILVTGVFGQRYGLMCVAGYLLLGLLGVPLFAGGGGWQYLASPTMGYLLGFLLVPAGIQRLLIRAFCDTGWFKGRTLWMASAAIVATLLVHLSGTIGLGIHTLLGHLSYGDALAWINQLTWPTLLYDMAFGWVAAASVRITRLLLWFPLY